jgi:hypothetical protein
VVEQLTGPRREVRRVPRLDQRVGHAAAMTVVPGGLPDRGEETYAAVTLDGGTVAVPVCRYVKGLNIANQQLT